MKNSQPHLFDEAPLFDKTLVNKYNRSGPRYTSYPTALEFQPIAEGIEQEILANRDKNAPLSLYFHIPFCRHLCYYCGCNKIITKKNADAGDYLQYLFAEIKQKRALLKGKPVVKQLHLGGGTPTFFTDDELVQLWQFLQTQFDFLPETEADYSIEIDPRELGDNTLKTLRKLGFNRVSFGVQDLEEEVQIAVNRVQSEELIRAVMAESQALGYHSINIDLIYGLPHQTVESLQRTVERIVDISSDRLSIFNYAHLPQRFPAQRKIKDEDLPTPTAKLTMLGNTINTLTDSGYQYIGIDHFAKPDDELAIAQREGNLHRNFQGYTTLGDCDLLGFGVSSISQLSTINDTVHDSKDDSINTKEMVQSTTNHILQNHTDLKVYKQMIDNLDDDDNAEISAVKHIQSTAEDQLRAYVIKELLCHDYVDFAVVKSMFNIDVPNYFFEEINQLMIMQADNLVSIDDKGIRVLRKGRMLGRNVAMVFDEYLVQKGKDSFSKAI